MNNIKTILKNYYGYNFVPKKFLLDGKDEYYYRNLQNPSPKNNFRNLDKSEIDALIKNNNHSDNWNDVLVSAKFNPQQIKNSTFAGLVRIGNIDDAILEHNDLQLPIGITNSLIISCDIGDNVAIHNVGYLAHYIINSKCILFNINEMHTTDIAKFGNGIIKTGEVESVRIWLEVMNEAGGRKILPFDGIICADAYLWAKYKEDKKLQEKLLNITQNNFDANRGYYGTVGKDCVLKNSRIIKDVKIGDSCYIKGANKLKNLTINSSETEKTQIGEGVELVNGIIGYGCHIFYGCKAVRFVMGNNSNLKYGGRLINSFLGDNSTISCCEVLNNLIFPSHEQHHNNSFLIASVIKGQSNVAAGATIGSNHNSRSNDNEVEAGRGFWPGLCTSIKHSCKFASFVLLSKADYLYELNIPFPFSLLNNNTSKDQLEIIPAYWWMYNMYALERNTWKFKNRDKRQIKTQNIEFDALAPDTIEEIFSARKLLEIYTAKAYLKKENMLLHKNENELCELGKNILTSSEYKTEKMEILAEEVEKSNRKVVILKANKSYQSYYDMICYYAIKNLIEFLNKDTSYSLSTINKTFKSDRKKEWVNLGGQLISQNDVEKIKNDIAEEKLKSWNDIHARYNELWKSYPLDKQAHAYASLCTLLNSQSISGEQWNAVLDKAINIQEYICDQVYTSRKKDYDNAFKKMTFSNEEEMNAVLGNIDDNSFIKLVKTETEEFINSVNEIKKRS